MRCLSLVIAATAACSAPSGSAGVDDNSGVGPSAPAASAAQSATVELQSLAEQDRLRPAVLRGARATQAHSWTDLGSFAPSSIKSASLSAATALPQSPAPLANFDALDDDLTVFPPDTMGTVGPNQLLVTLNNKLQVQSKSGAVLSTVSWPTFWAPVFSGSLTDPRCAYDPVAGRFIISMAGDPEVTTSSILLAVSQTSDATGRWNLYRVPVDPLHQGWADFPKLGFNKNWIVVQANVWQVQGQPSSPDAGNSYVWAFNKQDVYAAGSGQNTRFTIQQGSSRAYDVVPAVTYDATQETEYLLQAYPNQPANPLLKLYQITGPVGAETLTLASAPTAPLNWALGAGSDSAPQLGTSQLINAVDQGFTNVVVRNGSIWGAEGIYPDSSSSRSSVQWVQMSPSGSIQQFGRLDDASGTVHYSYPSLAVNLNSDVVIGFSRFTASQYASAGYAIHAAGDPAGSLRPEFVYKAELAPYVKDAGISGNRWGDYSATVIDPSSDSQFWTIQEIASTQQNGTSRWGTWWANVSTNVGSGLPDLVVTAVNWSPANVAAGQPATFSATVKNQGTGATPAGVIIGVGFSIDGTEVTWSDTDTQSLMPGASVTLTANSGPSGNSKWTAVSGPHSLLAWVDDVNRIAESNESNNKLTVPLTVGIDMTVTRISWAPASPVNGNAVTFSATVKNIGTVATPAGVIDGVAFAVDGTTVSWSDNSTASVAPGQSVTLTANSGPTGSSTWTARSGSHTVQAWVDDVNRYNDVNRSNNKLQTTLTVP